MTETRLRTLTHCAAYTLTGLVMLMLAAQNLRYGFYTLFYLAATIGTIALAGAIYSIVVRRRQLSVKGHLFLVAALDLVLAVTLVVATDAEVSHWIFPALLLHFLVLSVRPALVLSGILLVLLTGKVFLLIPATDALLVIVGALLIFATAAIYSWHYTHMAQSAEDLAITDPATGAHNARFLDDTLQKEVSRAQATGKALSVVQVRLDHMDQAAELHGNSAVQFLMRQVTDSLFEVIRAGDTLYAIDQGDFFLVLPFTPEEGVRVIVERIRRTLSENQWQIVGRLTATLGCTTWETGDTSVEHLRSRALAALDEARRRGPDKAWFMAGHQDAV
jgi:diguanylate cyclase (GGDEF)-like protein